MNDETDRYLSRCLKNWAARWQSPAQGRQRLLDAATKPESIHNKPFENYTLFKDRPFALSGESDPLMAALYSNRWLSGSFTLLQAWPLHMASPVNTNA
jgi:hypothetical protein